MAKKSPYGGQPFFTYRLMRPGPGGERLERKQKRNEIQKYLQQMNSNALPKNIANDDDEMNMMSLTVNVVQELATSEMCKHQANF